MTCYPLLLVDSRFLFILKHPPPFPTVEPPQAPITVPNAITVEQFEDVSQDSSLLRT